MKELTLKLTGTPQQILNQLKEIAYQNEYGRWGAVLEEWDEDLPIIE